MSVNEFNFEKWFNSLNKGEDIHQDHISALTELVSDLPDLSDENLVATRYRREHNFVVENIGMINKDEQGKYFIDVKLNRNENDITTAFMTIPSTGVNISLILNGNVSPINCGTVIVPECAMYTDLLIRLTFMKEPFDVKLQYQCYILKGEERGELMRKRFIHHGILYSDGVARNI